MKKTFLSVVLLSSFVFMQTKAQTDKPKSDPFSFETSYVGDFVGNASGGIKTGTAYLGMANIILGFETEKAGWWKGGSFFINGAALHGESPSEKLIGDFQIASNIDAGEHTYMHELWYKQQIGNIEFTIGLQDLNVDFAASENGSMYINSSFGIAPVISDNVPVPIFPLTGLGISFKWNIADKISLLGAAFDGCPSDFSENKYNLNWTLNDEEGLLTIGELQYETKKNLTGVYKIGYYYHTGLSETDENTGISTAVFNHNYGLYLIGDQTIWKKNEHKKIDLFAQLAFSPGDVNAHNYYIGGGMNYFGIFDAAGNDALGLAFAAAGFHNGMHKHETTIEAYYKAQLTENISIQPDIQYIINPSGSDEKKGNALVGFVRLGINF